jgi:hypothetical protein
LIHTDDFSEDSVTPQDREEETDDETPKPAAPARDHPNKPFRTPGKTRTHPAPEVGTDGQRRSPAQQQEEKD